MKGVSALEINPVQDDLAPYLPRRNTRFRKGAFLIVRVTAG